MSQCLSLVYVESARTCISVAGDGDVVSYIGEFTTSLQLLLWRTYAVHSSSRNLFVGLATKLLRLRICQLQPWNINATPMALMPLTISACATIHELLGTSSRCTVSIGKAFYCRCSWFVRKALHSHTRVESSRSPGATLTRNMLLLHRIVVVAAKMTVYSSQQSPNTAGEQYSIQGCLHDSRDILHRSAQSRFKPINHLPELLYGIPSMDPRRLTK